MSRSISESTGVESEDPRVRKDDRATPAPAERKVQIENPVIDLVTYEHHADGSEEDNEQFEPKTPVTPGTNLGAAGPLREEVAEAQLEEEEREEGAHVLAGPGEKAKEVYRLGVPIVLSVMVTNIMTLTSFAFAGNYLGAEYLAYASISSTLFMVTGFYTGYGMACSLDMYCTQEYGRCADSPLIGYYLVKSLTLTALSAIPLSLVWLNAAFLLSFFAPPDAVGPCSEFLQYGPFLYIPAVFASAMAKFLQAQHITTPMLFASTCAICVSFPAHFVFVPPLGISGLAVAQCCAYTAQCLVLAYFVQRKCSGTTWTGFKREALHDFGPFCRSSFSAMIATVVEGCSFEMTTVTPMLMGASTTAMAANSLLNALLYMTFPLQFGLSAAAAVVVGNAIGASKFITARHSVVVSLGCAFGQSLVDGVLLYFLHDHLFSIFTHEATVKAIAAAHIAALIGCHQIDLLQYTFQGVCRGFGRFKLAAAVTVVGQWFVAVPLGFLMYYLGSGIGGAYLGFMIGAAFEVCLFTWKLTPVLNGLVHEHPHHTQQEEGHSAFDDENN